MNLMARLLKSTPRKLMTVSNNQKANKDFQEINPKIQAKNLIPQS